MPSKRDLGIRVILNPLTIFFYFNTSSSFWFIERTLVLFNDGPWMGQYGDFEEKWVFMKSGVSWNVYFLSIDPMENQKYKWMSLFGDHSAKISRWVLKSVNYRFCAFFGIFTLVVPLWIVYWPPVIGRSENRFTDKVPIWNRRNPTGSKTVKNGSF